MPQVKLALGTVQFGLSYGIANSRGQVGLDQAREVVTVARSSGLDTLDTAIAYGQSEATLGQLDLKDFKLITKLPALPDDCTDVRGWVEMQLADSFERLGCSRIHGLLLHRPEQLLGGQGAALYCTLNELKRQGLVEKVGVSIYEPQELDRLFDDMHFDLVQAPFNLLDARLIDSGWLQRLPSLGCELHVRSVFMQGLLLMPVAERPVKFSRWTSLWREWDDWLHASELTPVQACLRYALAFSEISRVVVGVDSAQQLEEIVQATSGELPEIPSTLRSNDPDLLNPSRWNQL